MLSPPPLRALSLALTFRCNLSCPHCRFEPAGPDLEPAAAREAIERWVGEAETDLHLAFQGGEPFLRAELALECCRLARRLARARGLRVRCSAVSNGLLLDGPLLRQLGELEFHLMLSIDGPPEVQARSRGALAVRAWDVLRRALEVPGLEVGTVTTLTPLTAPHLAETAERLVSLGVRDLDVTPDLYARWDPGSIRDAVNGVQAMLRRAGDTSPPASLGFLERARAGRGRCPAGLHGIAVSSDGTLHGCSQLVPARKPGERPDAPPVLESLSLGVIRDLGTPCLDRERARLRASGPLSPPCPADPDCADCPAADWCHLCPAFALTRPDPCLAIPEIQCALNRALVVLP